MNKLRYRVIFNQARCLLMAVSEIGRSHGGGASLASFAAATHAPRLVMARLRPVAFAVLALAGAQMFCLPAARAQIVADPSAPKAQQPVIVNTANGLPQVNIATPSAAGVSRNTYSQFDVNKPGAILNNARNDAQTQLGGWVQRNPNLANGTARVILNEVNSSNPSMLRGYVEVAGDRAQVIIANPSGVTCDGCGFINAARSTLTTGAAILNNGNLDGYLVRGGVVTVQGDGMDASQSDFTDIISRAAKINAGIWSRELRVTTGSNRVDADNARTDKQAAVDAAPAFGIDVAQLGGMYANRIVLVGTEAGVGMRNAGNIGAAAGEVRISADGHIENSGKLVAKQALSVLAGSMANEASGTILANQLSLNATDAHTLVNRGLIDGQETFIDTPTLRNLGTGRIYGDRVAITATTVYNEAETVNGVSAAPVIAARQRMDIGAAEINNREHAMLFSAGDMAIGGALDSTRQAVGQAVTVNNNSAAIEALGALALTAKAVNNTNEHFKTEIVEIGREWRREFQYSGAASRYQESEVAIINDEADDMWLRDANGNPSVKLGNNFNRYDYTRVITESRIAETDPGKISSGGAMRVTADTVNNDKSQIMAGGAMSGAIGTLNNTEVPGQRIITDTGTAYHFYSIERKGRDEQGMSVTGYYPGAVVQAISLTPTVYRQNAAVSGSGTRIDAFPYAGMNSLFSINANPAVRYLVQSDPRFTNYRNWLSSDYMLHQLNADPSLTQKRLGDGFYEQKLMREQVAELTGRRFLDGYSSDEAQYRALLDAGVTVARQYNLKVGVELSAEQIARLTADVVLLVEKDITLPDGSVTKALVPQLYVRLKDGDINGAGALLSADSINLQLNGDANNSGTIAGRSLLSINAGNINNIGGRITAKDAIVKASLDVNNLGGAIDGGNSLTVNARRDLNLISTTRDSATDQATRTSVDRVAALYVANPNATLVASAGRDINFNAAQITNSGAGGSTLLAADGNINLGTVTEKSTQSLTWDANNYRKEALASEVGSSISTNGDLRLLAGNNIDMRGARLSSDKGAIDLSAAGNVNIATASATQSVDEGHQTTGSSGMLSRKTVTTRDQLEQSQALGSTISGNTVTAMAGHDLGVSGSNVVSTAGTRLGANNNVTIAAASDQADTSHLKNEVTSGLFSGGGFGVTIGTQELDNQNRTISRSAVSSTVGSTDGKVSIVAGNAYAQTGSNVLAPKGDIDIVGKKVDIVAAIDSERNTQDMVFKQSGLTLQITSPILSAIQTAQQMKKAAESTSDSRMQLLAAANIGFAGKNAVDAVQAGQGQKIGESENQIVTGKNDDGTVTSRDANAADKAGGINLAISIGVSKNESHSESKANTARSSTVSAGGNVNIAAQGAGADSNIVVQGSDIKAGINATLKADNEVKLLAAQNTTEQHSSNKGMSGSIGISIGTDGLLFNAGLSGSRGRGDGKDLTQVNTHVDAGNKLTIASGSDTTLKGATVSGKQVVMDVGTSGSGNLNIESLQDTSTYKSSQQSLGVSISAGMGKISGSLNASRSSVDGNYASVNEQSGIKAGDDGFQIKVAGNTDLKGGKIASTDKAAAEGKNSLTTETLTQSDIQNRSDYKAESQSVGIGAGYGGSKLSMNGTGVGMGSSSGSESSTTKSGISQGDVKITDAENQQAKTGLTVEQTLASINTDVSSERDTSGKIVKNWDGQKLQADVQAQAQITQMFGKEASKAIGDYATKQVNQLDDKIKFAKTDAEKAALMDERAKWEEGGLYRTALHTAVGALGGGIGGALGAATSSVAMPKIGELISGMDLPLAVKQGLAQVTAVALGGMVGGAAGLAAGVNVEANNRQLHLTEAEKLSGLKKGKSKDEQDRLDAAACTLVRCADGVPKSDPYYNQLMAMQNRGATYEKELTELLKTGEFIYQPLFDAARDLLTRNGEVTQRTGGAADLLLGTVGVIGSGALVTTGAAGCVPTGAACALVPLGVYLAAISGMQAQDGSHALTGPYNSNEGQRVLDSFNVGTYPGERDPLAELGIDAGKLGLTYLFGKYIPKGLAKIEEKTIGKGSPKSNPPTREPLSEQEKINANAQRDDGDLYGAYRKENGEWEWPKNSGFKVKPEEVTLPVGAKLDRYGDSSGGFLAPAGTPFNERALAPGSAASTYHRYEVVKPLPVLQGEIAPAFGEKGGGIQMLPQLVDGKRVNVQWLLMNGYLKEVN